MGVVGRRLDVRTDRVGDRDLHGVVRNDAVLARYPKLDWVPTLIELDASGRALRAVPSTAFHDGDRLAPAKVRAFLHGGN